MNEDLLPFFDEELRFMRDMMGEFAEAYPKIAGRLRISKEAVEDPHVERLIQAFAFLNARLRLKLDDMFPELTDGLLSILYPQFLEPIPSATIVQLQPKGDLEGVAVVPRGTQLETEPVDGETCLYTTSYDVPVGAYRVESARMLGRPLAAPKVAAAANATACLRVRLECLGEGKTFTDLGLASVRFHIAGESRLANVLYEVIHNNTLVIALADREDDPNPVILPKERIARVGFAPGESLLRAGASSSRAHGLLAEYFAFPEKFLFFEVSGLEAKTLAGAKRQLDLYIYFDHAPDYLERSVGAENFRLFATPAVNAFAVSAEPLRIDGLRSDYRIVPSARRESTLEVLRVERVTLSNDADGEVKCQPFFSIGREAGDETWFWQARRQRSGAKGGGDDVFLSFVGGDPEAAGEQAVIASIDTLCTNRNLPSKLPFGGGQPRFTPTIAVPAITGIQCLSAPTRTLRPAIGRDGYWRLVSQLTLNHLSISGDAAGAKALREMLSIHNHQSTPGSRAVIDSLHSVESRPATTRAPGGGQLAFCSGVDVILTLDDERFSGTGGFLLATVLDRFLARYCAINSFSRLRIDLWKDRTTLTRFPARSGDMALV